MINKACRDCGNRILIATRAIGNGVDVLDATPVADDRQDGNVCAVVVGEFSWPPDALTEQIAFNRELSLEQARDVAREDFTWHTRHHCKERAA